MNTTTPTPTNELYTVNQAAEMLEITPLRVYQLREARATGVRVGRRWLFSPDDIERMKPDDRFRRKDYANPPSRNSLASRMRLTKLRRGVWWTDPEGVTYVAREEDLHPDEDRYRFYRKDAADGLEQLAAFRTREELLDTLRRYQPDLRRWRRYA